MNKYLNIGIFRCFAHFFLSWIPDYCISSFVEHFFDVHCINTNILFGCLFSLIFIFNKHGAGNSSFSQEILKFLPHHVRELRKRDGECLCSAQQAQYADGTTTGEQLLCRRP